jgi:hypothetical protein
MKREKRKIAVIDAETDPFVFGKIPKYFLFGFFNGENYIEFKHIDELIKYCSDKYLTIYAHNGGRFDFHLGILSYLKNFDPIKIINGRIAKFDIGKCEFRDSYLILPTALSKYKKDEIDYDIFTREKRNIPENYQKIRKYLENDCRYLYEYIDAFIKLNGKTLTLASAAMRQCRKIEKIVVPKGTKIFHDFFVPFYFGGRVQAFKTGYFDKKLISLDINSAYPYAMTFNHPWLENYYIDDKITDDTFFVELEAEKQGYFPLRTNAGLTFPTGGGKEKFKITIWEYKAAQKIDLLGHKILRTINFPEKINFKKYVEFYFKIKKEALPGSADREIAKKMLNGLYGKYGASPTTYNEKTGESKVNYKDYCVAEHKFKEQLENDDEGYKFCGELDKWALFEKNPDTDTLRYYNKATAASITGFTRAVLLNGIFTVKNPVYCDTDGLKCENAGSLKLSDQLGDWKLEHTLIKGYIAGKKLYAFKTSSIDPRTKKTVEILSSKGVKFNYQDFERLYKQGKINYNFEAPTFTSKHGVKFTHREVKFLYENVDKD